MWTLGILFFLAFGCGTAGDGSSDSGSENPTDPNMAAPKQLVGALNPEVGSPAAFRFGVISHPTGPYKLYPIQSDGTFTVALGSLKENDLVSFGIFDASEKLVGYVDFESTAGLQGIVGLSASTVTLSEIELPFDALGAPERGNRLIGLPFGMEVVASGGEINDLVSAGTEFTPTLTPHLQPSSADALLNGFYRLRNLAQARRDSTSLVVAASAAAAVSRVWVEHSTNDFAKSARLANGRAWVETGFELTSASNIWTATVVPGDVIAPGYLAEVRYRTSSGGAGGLWREIESLPTNVPKLLEFGFSGTAAVNYADETVRNGLSRSLCATAGGSATLVYSQPTGITAPFQVTITATYFSADGVQLAAPAPVATSSDVAATTSNTFTLPTSAFPATVGSTAVSTTKIAVSYTATTGSATSFAYFAYCP